jgi:hypothetical protein
MPSLYVGGGVTEWVEDCWTKDYHGTPVDDILILTAPEQIDLTLL